MDRKKILLKHADTTKPGLEIAPYFNPTIRKSDGYDLQTLDVFDTVKLRELAMVDRHIPEGGHLEIEPVDHVSDACGLGDIVTEKGLAGHFGYILSSHNFEHLPNPIRFLQGAEKALQPGGTLSMAIPDYRCCFDHFRFPTRLSDWLMAFHEHVAQPSPATQFDSGSNHVVSARPENGPFAGNFADEEAPASVLTNDIGEAYQSFLKRLESQGQYVDAHCSVMFPEIFELHLRDLSYLGLTGLEMIEIHPTFGIEFVVHLRKPVDPAPRPNAEEHCRTRHALLTVINRQLGSAAFGLVDAPYGNARRKKIERAAARILGTETVSVVRAWNLRRLEKRRERKRTQ